MKLLTGEVVKINEDDVEVLYFDKLNVKFNIEEIHRLVKVKERKRIKMQSMDYKP